MIGHRRRLVIAAGFFGILISVAACSGEFTPLDSRRSSPLDTTYRIDGRAFDLVKGISKVEAAPGSATIITTEVFGEVASGDLNGDGTPDAAVILVHDPGGSGTFFYVAAAVHSQGGYQGTSAVLLGDRITPVDLSIENSAVKVKYLDRQLQDPMTVATSVEKSVILILEDGRLELQPPASRIEDQHGGKIGFDLLRLDETGLYGPPDGKRALSYEFCIPIADSCRSEVKAIDPSVEFMRGSPGRIGCGANQVLCIGSTHQPDFRNILEKLANLSYVQRIEECFFE